MSQIKMSEERHGHPLVTVTSSREEEQNGQRPCTEDGG